jgi:hypothetical protein
MKQATTPARSDWRDTLGNAADLALLGIVTAVAMLPVVTAGAAVATASAAVHDWLPAQRWPDARTNLARFGRAVLPGLGAVAVALALAVLVWLDLSALSRGAVPGGVPAMLLTAAVAAAVVGVGALAVVEVGRAEGHGWGAALRRAGRTAYARPGLVLGLVVILGIAAVLCYVLPITTPILLGYALFALHVAAR